MSMTVGGANASSNVTGLGPTASLQLMFAKMQLELAETAKSGAMTMMKEIQDSQAEQKQVSNLLQQARQLQANASDKSATSMTPEMVAYMDKHGLAYDKTGSTAEKKDVLQSKEEWKVAIASLEARQEQLGTDTQQKMVFIQDYMGQYNSYLQGANSQISSANQTLTSLARGQ